MNSFTFLRKKHRTRTNLLAAFSVLAPLISQAQTPDTLMAVKDNSQNHRMSLYKNGGFLLGGEYTGTGGSIVAEGAGTRLLWYPEKAAFRAGYASGTQWDNANVGDFSVGLGEGNIAWGTNSVALGRLCLASGFAAFAMGDQNTASGAASVALGYHSHTNARQGSFVFADRSSLDTVRAGINHSATWRVSGGFRLFTSSNLSTGVTIQSGASVSNWGQSSAVISTSTGAMLTTAGVWQNTSDVNRKHMFEPISGEEVLQKLRGLDIQKWSYKVEPDNIRHIGPTAQDFHAAFGLGGDDKTIGTVDADGIALAAVQALDERSIGQAAAIKKLQEENKDLRKKLEDIESRLNNNTAGFPVYLTMLALVLLVGGVLFNKRFTFFPTKK